MPYVLRAIVARCHVLAPPPDWIADSRVVPLPQGFCILPLTQALRYRFGPPERPWLHPTHAGFTGLPDGLVPLLAELSRGGALAYLEAEYHGGEGEQRSVVWEDGQAREPEEGSYAIDAALRRLGVERAENADCFDALGLGRHRDVEDWLAQAAPAAEPVAVAPPAPAPERRAWWRFWG